MKSCKVKTGNSSKGTFKIYFRFEYTKEVLNEMANNHEKHEKNYEKTR